MKTTTESITTKWTLDPTHSELVFKVKHLMITNVKGEFRKFSAEIDGDDFTKSPISVTIDAASIFTNEDQRDGHLKSADFFDVENYPTLTFKSTSLKQVDDDDYMLKGILTIRDVSKEIELDVEFGGVNKDPVPERAGIESAPTTSRNDLPDHLPATRRPPVSLWRKAL